MRSVSTIGKPPHHTLYTLSQKYIHSLYVWPAIVVIKLESLREANKRLHIQSLFLSGSRGLGVSNALHVMRPHAPVQEPLLYMNTEGEADTRVHERLRAAGRGAWVQRTHGI
jgi:hypothetical protein